MFKVQGRIIKRVNDFPPILLMNLIVTNGSSRSHTFNTKQYVMTGVESNKGIEIEATVRW